ncbi:MAG TPA: MXAN_5187 C-terminal domain-containing protein [Pyrinomonadaceae bacterium]
MPIRDNKLARSSQQRAKPNATADDQPTVDEQLTRLEEDMRRLKIEYDIYFNGGSKRPPYDTKSRVETMIKRLGDDRTLNFAQRYRYNSLATRYNSFRELWRRTIQAREEGRDAASAARASAPGLEQSARQDQSSFVCSDAHGDVQTVKQIYEALIEAKRKCGEAVDDLSFPRFHHLIATKTANLKEHLGCQSVRFSIDVEGGRVNFKAKADQK